MNTEEAQYLVEKSVVELYVQLQQGMDVRPGDALRLEGKIELLLDYTMIEWGWLKAVISQCYYRYFGVELTDAYWYWLESEGRFFLPLKMQDAPVYKG